MNDKLRTAIDHCIGVTGTVGSITIADLNSVAALLAALGTAAYMSIRAAHAWRNYREKKDDKE